MGLSWRVSNGLGAAWIRVVETRRYRAVVSNIGMTEENLDGAEIGASFQHVCGIAVAVHVRRSLFC